MVERVFTEVTPGTLMLVALAGMVLFAIVAAIHLVREKSRIGTDHDALVDEHAAAQAELERARAFLTAQDQRIVVWHAFEPAPQLHGDLPAASGAPTERAGFLAFGTWLAPQSASPFEHAIEALRESATGFRMQLTTRAGTLLEANGRASGAVAFVRFTELTHTHSELATLRGLHGNLEARNASLLALLEACHIPVWERDPQGVVVHVNDAYARAVESVSAQSAARHAATLLDRKDREAIAAFHEGADVPSFYRERLHVTVAGDRRTMDVAEIVSPHGTTGIAVDASEVETMQSSLRETLDSHVRTLDHLASAVITFDAGHHVRFYNRAFLRLWSLKPAQVDDLSNEGFFDLLRSEGRIAEPKHFREWRDRWMSVYQSNDAAEERWHTPDGRTIRTVANPGAHGGVTWVFEDITEEYQLKSRYAALVRVREQTLDHLGEAIAVFGPDGRLKLSNPAFERTWHFKPVHLVPDTPIATIVDGVSAMASTDARETWNEIAAHLTDVHEDRERLTGRMTVQAKGDEEERVLDWTLAPLPGAQSMLTFADVTDSENVAQALRETAQALGERAEALEAGETAKTEFMRHISREFREPLTNILGFSDMLSSGMTGSLSDQQNDYIGYISTSAGTMHQMVDNILDLAIVDGGLAQLDMIETDAAEIVTAAAETVTDLLRERSIHLALDIAPDVGRVVVDPVRMRQVLHNLLANAVRHSPANGTVHLGVSGTAADVAFTVSDEGPGIPEDARASIFSRFHAGSGGGAGLGLAVAKSFVDLHAGEIGVEDATQAPGAHFICRIPRQPLSQDIAAE